MAAEHTFFGIWEIVECSVTRTSDAYGLKGIKFRLDEMGDITWYNDQMNPNSEQWSDYPGMVSKDSDSHQASMRNESADVLFSCETFEVVELTSNGPGLSFGAYAGHNIEFQTTTFTPKEYMTLNCEGWCYLSCKRVKEDQTTGQAAPFSLLHALHEAYFDDVIIKSSDGLYFEAHSAVLRLNGFDCSMNYKNHNTNAFMDIATSSPSSSTTIKSAGFAPESLNDEIMPSAKFQENSSMNKMSSSHYLLPPPNILSAVKSISGSFNCLTTSLKENQSILLSNSSSSDSDLRLCSPKEVFNFSIPFVLTPTNETTSSGWRKQQQSPSFRCSSPFSLSPSCLDTPPMSPLTPISVLYNLPYFMLTPIFHWLYSESLPVNLKEDICEKLIKFSEVTPSLNKLIEPCKKYLKNLKLKKFIINTAMAMHSALNRIIQSINPNTISRNPEILCSVFKQGVKETAIGCVKLLQFCNIFVKEGNNLSRHQRHEIIKFARSRLPIFISQIHQLLRNIFDVLSNLIVEERHDLAVYLVPQIEITLEKMTSVIVDIKTSLEKMYEDLKSSSAQQQQQRDAYNRGRARNEGIFHGYQTTYQNQYDGAENDLTFVLYMYEVKKMRDIYGRVQSAMEIIEQNRNTFREMTVPEKERTIRHNLDYLILELPSYINRIESISDNVDANIGWKEFKFCFKLATGQINGVISKLLEHKGALKNSVLRICNLVGREEFRESLLDLGMYDDNNSLKSDQNIIYDTDPSSSSISASSIDYNSVKLNLMKNLCEPPPITCSSLSKNALRLLHSGHLSDMEFEVIVPSSYPTFNNCNNLNNKNLSKNNKFALRTNVHIFRAHRVIVAARCEWFKKALLSGMKEDINRKITIHDTSPVIFRRLLLYLYGAPIDKTVGAEQICELMLLADRYSIDELKDICEQTLKLLIDEESVICLLSIADRFNASILKVNCLSFISNHNHLTKIDMFLELSPILQNEVKELIQWCGRTPEPWSNINSATDHQQHCQKSPSKLAKTRSRKSSPSFM